MADVGSHAGRAHNIVQGQMANQGRNLRESVANRQRRLCRCGTSREMLRRAGGQLLVLRPFDYGLQGLLSSGGALVLHFDGTWNGNVHCSHLHQKAQRLADTTSGTQHDDLALRKVRRRKAAGASYCEGLAGLQQGVHDCKGIGVRPGGEEVSRRGAARRLCDRGAVRRNLALVRK